MIKTKQGMIYFLATQAFTEQRMSVLCQNIVWNGVVLTTQEKMFHAHTMGFRGVQHKAVICILKGHRQFYPKTLPTMLAFRLVLS